MDFDADVNKNPKQELDESEDIEVLRVPVKSLMHVRYDYWGVFWIGRNLKNSKHLVESFLKKSTVG